MRDPVSPLGNASFDGFCKIREIGPLGMISLRAKPDVKELAKAVKAAVGTKLPAQRRIEIAGDKACGWMSPDEYILILPYGETDAAMAAIAKAMPAQLSSTAQDMARGRPTEIDHLNGFVVRRGAELGVPTPLNQALHALVKGVDVNRSAG